MIQILSYVVGMISNNNYLLWDDDTNEACIIDASGEVFKLAADAERKLLKVKYIILTHGHFDHTGGLDYFRSVFKDAKLVACRKEADMLYDRKLSKGKGGIVADIWVKDGDSLKLGENELKFIETPGHSKGSMCILTGNVLFSGDTLFQASIGRTDLPGGDFEQIKASIQNKLYVLPDDTRVLPGHNDETTIGFEKRYNPFV